MGILKTPLIPQRKVNTVLMSSFEKEGIATLGRNGIQVISTQPHNSLAPQVSHHADMLFLHINSDKCVVIDKNTDFCAKLKNIGFNLIQAENNYSPKYPYDVGLNCLILDEMVIGNIKHIDNVVKRELCKYEFINVPQGYTKCSVCIVNNNSLITEDESIYKALKNKFDVLKIESNCVELKGYNYGFFGGCTGLIDKNLLAVNGELKNHKSYKEIVGFLKQRNIDILELKAGNLTDIGSILPVEEK